MVSASQQLVHEAIPPDALHVLERLWAHGHAAYAVGGGIRDALLGRPGHDIDLTTPEAGDGRGQVDVVEPLGATTLIHVRVDGPSRERARVVISSDTRIAVDDRVGFRLRRDRLHLFDGRTGERLE